MSDDEQSPRSLRMKKKKKGGPNWFMIAGGAVVMAVSVALGRKEILNERARNHRPASTSHDDDDGDTRSVDTYETVHDGTPFWNKVESHADPFESRSFKTKRAAPSDQSPQASKLRQQLSRNSVCQSNHDPAPCDTHTSTALRARRELVHRLRQQIRSRDAMIHDMQTQLEDQEQMISMHRNHSADLQECVQAVSAKLFEANLDVQRLHRELSAQPVADLDDECIDIAVAEIKRKWVHPKDVEEIILEARRLNEEVERLQREEEVKDNLAQAKSRQCELLSKKVSSLATELQEVKTAAHGKQRLLEAKEQENLKLTSVLHDLQQKLQIESRANGWARSSKLIRRTDALNMNSGWKMNHSIARPVTPPNFEGVSSTYEARDGHRNYHQLAGSVSLGKPYASVHARNDSQQDSEDSVAKAESGQDDEGLIQRFDNEVDQVASALSATSKVVSEKMQAVTRILKKFQKHCESRTDVQSDAEGFNFSQVFFCLSAEERRELRNELEQAAKQQDVEREMKVLTKHRTKLEELKYVVAKVSARFNAKDDTSNTEVLQLASSLSDIEQKLALQEDIVQETSLIVEQLSKLFHVSSPQSPPIQKTQEIWRTVKETSGATSSVNGRHAQSDENSSSASRNALPSRGEETPSRILERQDSCPAPRQHFGPSTESLYQFHLGASDGPVSTSRTRRTASRPKPAANHESTVGSKRQSTTCRPSADVFSVGFSARDSPQQLEGIVETAAPYAQEQPGDRMSSPEPEPTISPSFSKRFRPCSAETSPRIPTPAKLRLSAEDIDSQIKRSTEETNTSNADCSPRIGASPFAARMACLDVRQPCSPVASLRNFEDEDSQIITRLVERDSSGSCNSELGPSDLTFLPSLPRRSSSSNRQR